jgi:predicted ArsR family transcriptional regulator
MMRLRAHNPGQLSDADLDATFVARLDTYRDLLDLIRRQPERGPLQHVILIGERGMGKTTLGLRTLLGVRQDPALSRLWQPVPFPEESYAVAGLGDLWIEALRRLSIATGDPSWGARAEGWVRTERDDARLRARARDALTEFRMTTGLRPILFVENIDEILGKFEEIDLSRLREDLQSRDDVMLLASATQRFQRIAERNEAFYEFFRTIDLSGVDAAGTRAIVAATARALNCEGLKSAQARVAVIRTLTGGNPRLIHLTTRLVAQSPHGSAREDFERLLDDQTPYFKARIDALPAQQAKLFYMLAEIWKPASAADLATPMRLSSSQVSAQLKKLEETQLIHRTAVAGRKRTYYEVSARLFNLYLVMRSSHDNRRRLESIVRFLAELYGEDALTHIAETSRHWLASPVEPGTREEHELVLDVVTKEMLRLRAGFAAPDVPSVDDGEQDRRGLVKILQEIYGRLRALAMDRDVDGARRAYSEFVDRLGGAPATPSERYGLALAHMAMVFAFGTTGDTKAASDIFTHLVTLAAAHPDDPALRKEQAKAAANLINALGRAGDLDGARALYNGTEALAARHPGEPALREWQAKAAVNLINALGDAGDLDGARALYAGVEALAARHPDGPVLRERQAKAAVNLINALGNAGDLDGARALYAGVEALAARHPDEPALREQQAKAAVNLITDLGNAGDLDGARALYAGVEALAARHPDEPALREQQANAAVNLINALGNSGDLDGARALYAGTEALAARHPDEPALREQQANAAVNLINALGNAGDLDGARALYAGVEALAARHPDEPALRERQANAAFNLITDLGNAGDLDGARALHAGVEALAARHPDEPALRERQANAAFNLINALGNSGDLDGARALYAGVEALAARHPDEPALREQQANATFNLINALGNAGDLDGARALYAGVEALAARHPDEPALREQQAKAVANLILALCPAGSAAEISTLFKRLIASRLQSQIYIAVGGCADYAAAAGNWPLVPLALDRAVHLDGFVIPDDAPRLDSPVPWLVYLSQRPARTVVVALERMGVADRVEPVYRLAQEEAGLDLPQLPKEVRDVVDVIRPIVAGLRAGRPPAEVFRSEPGEDGG